MRIKNNFSVLDNVWFKETDIKKINMMSAELIHVISTVCPDYPNNGQRYTFEGDLGSGISLTAQEHLSNIPYLLKALEQHSFEPKWKILVADLPELVDFQREFFERICGSKEEYLFRCAQSASLIQKEIGTLADVQTFSDFYKGVGINYLEVQEQVARKVMKEGQNPPFKSKFISFAISRTDLAQRFRGRRLSEDEILEAAAHGMSLYITHGTLLRKVFLGQNLIVTNHRTPNLQNFYLCNFVSGYESLLNTPKFPLGILQKELY